MAPVLAHEAGDRLPQQVRRADAEDIAEKTKALMKAAKLKKGRAKNAPSPVLAISGAAKIGMHRAAAPRLSRCIQETRAKRSARRQAAEPSRP